MGFAQGQKGILAAENDVGIAYNETSLGHQDIGLDVSVCGPEYRTSLPFPSS